MVKIKTGDVAGFINDTKQKWAAFDATTPFTYYFLDDRFASLYTAEKKTGELFTLFAVIAILIACLGLFGLVSFTTQQRAKEISIRKVLGASVSQVLLILSKDFIGLVCIAFLISIPVAGWLMHSWLNNFAYRIQIAWWIFLLAGVLAIFVSLITISFQAIRAATANPVKSLRSE
jgi:putative ABC transport system permease protein